MGVSEISNSKVWLDPEFLQCHGKGMINFTEVLDQEKDLESLEEANCGKADTWTTNGRWIVSKVYVHFAGAIPWLVRL
jgi:hypothetical protein